MTTEQSITIVLADDHAVVRSGLRLLLEAEPDFDVVGEAGDVESTRRTVLAAKPAVLVLDLNMPGETSSLDAIQTILSASPGTRVVVLTMLEEPEFAQAALRAGALGYVQKAAADNELVEAVRRAAAGERYVNPSLGAALAAQAAGPLDGLSEREVQILRLIALGHTNAEIAKQVHLSVRTVESHRANIQHKLGLTTRAELVRYALDRGLLDVR